MTMTRIKFELLGDRRGDDFRCLAHIDYSEPGTPVYTAFECTYCGEEWAEGRCVRAVSADGTVVDLHASGCEHAEPVKESCHCGGTIEPSTDEDADLSPQEWLCGSCLLVYPAPAPELRPLDGMDVITILEERPHPRNVVAGTMAVRRLKWHRELAQISVETGIAFEDLPQAAVDKRMRDAQKSFTARPRAPRASRAKTGMSTLRDGLRF
jgi:hypothetical protein